MIGVFATFPPSERAHRGRARKRRVVARRDLPASRQESRQFPQLTRTQCAADVRQAIVVTELLDLVVEAAALLALPEVAVDAVVAKAPNARGERGVVGGNHAPF